MRALLLSNADRSHVVDCGTSMWFDISMPDGWGLVDLRNHSHAGASDPECLPPHVEKWWFYTWDGSNASELSLCGRFD